jgi:hypothetical protein
MYSGITKINYRKTVGHVFTKIKKTKRRSDVQVAAEDTRLCSLALSQTTESHYKHIRVKFESHNEKNTNDFGLQSIVYVTLPHSNLSLCFSWLKRNYKFSQQPTAVNFTIQ